MSTELPSIWKSGMETCYKSCLLTYSVFFNKITPHLSGKGLKAMLSTWFNSGSYHLQKLSDDSPIVGCTSEYKMECRRTLFDVELAGICMKFETWNIPLPKEDFYKLHMLSFLHIHMTHDNAAARPFTRNIDNISFISDGLALIGF